MSIVQNLKYSLLAVMMLSVVFAVMDTVPQEAEAAQPTVTIAFDQATKEAKVEPGESGLVIFTGTLTAGSVGPGSNVQFIKVDLEASSENGWVTTVTPSSVVFGSAGGTQPFTLTVRAPPTTSYRIADRVTIGGRANTIPGALNYNIPDTQATVIVEQYYRFSVECSKPYVVVTPAGQLVYSLKINNEGNGQDKFQFEVGNWDKLSDDGWTVQLSANSIEIEEKESQTIKIQVSTPIDFIIVYKNDLQAIKIQISSYGSESVAGLPLMEEYFVYCRQKGSYVPAFDFAPALFALVALAVAMGARLTGGERRRLR